MGITLRDIIYDIGEGIPGNKEFKAAQTGGPSGGCLPSSMLDLPVDFDSLEEAGSMMGSGGMIIMDEDTCMVDVAKFFIQFTNDESCGKCTTCRDGSGALLEVLTRITKGNGQEGDIDFLEELGSAIIDGSLCGLGTSLPNPVLSTIRHFRDEYVAHIREKRCPGLVCKDLIKYYIQPKKCVGCLLCIKNCPTEAIRGELKHVHIIDDAKCTKCGTCLDVCPAKIGAIVKVSGAEARTLVVLEKPIPIAEARKLS
jgi:ferredoxin